MAKVLSRIVLLGLILSLTGCWDRVEIEDRGFVIGTAVDSPEKENVEQYMEREAKKKPRGKQRYVLTAQVVVPGALSQQGDGGSSGAGNAFMNISSEGDSMFEISRQLATRLSRSPFFPHNKILVVSEELAKSGHFANIIDYFLRDDEMRRATKVMIAKGQAQKVLEVTPGNEKLPTMYINSVAENKHRTARMSPPIRIGDLHEKLLVKQSYTLPRVVARENEVKIGGVAVFHGHSNKMVAWLGEEETEGLSFLKGEIEGGVLKINIEDNLVIYEIMGAEQSLKADISNPENIQFSVAIKSEGNIAESLETIDYLDNPEIWMEIEKKLAEEIERMANDTLDKLHKQLKVDAVGFGAYLQREHPKTWDSIKEDWDHGENFFAKSTINVNADVIVRNQGVINKSEPKQE